MRYPSTLAALAALGVFAAGGIATAQTSSRDTTSPVGATNPADAKSPGGTMNPSRGTNPDGTMKSGGATRSGGTMNSSGATDRGDATRTGGAMKSGSATTSGSTTSPAGTKASGASSMKAEANPTRADAWLAKAGVSDLFEIQSSQLALQKSSSDPVRRFAQMMIDHHTKTSQEVKAAAKAAQKTAPTPKLEPQQQKMMAELEPLSGKAFDAKYLEQQRTAHQKALALHQNYAKNGDTPQLRKIAETAVPLIQQHIRELQTLPSS